jgi:hypothetical protein
MLLVGIPSKAAAARLGHATAMLLAGVLAKIAVERPGHTST